MPSTEVPTELMEAAVYSGRRSPRSRGSKRVPVLTAAGLGRDAMKDGALGTLSLVDRSP